MKRQWAKVFIFSRENGMTLVEVVVALGISAVVGLGASSLISYGYSEYTRLVAENDAQQNLLLASYYLRNYLNQAVNTACMGSSAVPLVIPAGPVALGTAPLPVGGTPVQIPRGVVDCRPGITAWTAGQTNAIAIFNRENGGMPAGPNAGLAIDSAYQGIGIYFSPPLGVTPGILYFANAAGAAVASNGQLNFSDVVNISVEPQTVIASQANDALESLTYDIKVRYFISTSGTKLYDYYANAAAVPAGIASYKDIDMLVPVSLYDNSLGSMVSGSTTSERLNGGIYYFRFSAPPSISL